MDEYEEIKEKLKKFFEKKMLSNETVYFILKDMQEEIWDDIRNESDDEDYLDDSDDLDDDEEDQPEEDFDDSDEEPEKHSTSKPMPKINKGEAVKTFLKKPKVNVKDKEKLDDLDGLN